MTNSGRAVVLRLKHLLTWLTKPHASLQNPEDRRRARLVAAFLSLFTIAAIIERIIYGNVPLSIVFLLAAAYLLSRSRYFQAAAILTLVFMSIPPFIAAFTLASYNADRINLAFSWLSLPVLAATLFFSLRGLALTVLVYLVGIISLPFLIPDFTFGLLTGTLGYFLAFSSLVIIITYQRSVVEQSRQAELTTSRKQTEEALRRRTAQLTALREIGLELAAQLKLELLLRVIATHVKNLLNCDRGGFHLYRPDQDALELVVKIDPANPLLLGSMIKPGDGLVGRIWQTGQPMVVNRYRQWPGKSTPMTQVEAAFPSSTPGSVLGVPVQWGSEALGVLVVAAELEDRYTEADMELLSLFAAQAALAIHNARMHEQVQHHAAELEQEVAERKQVETALRTSDERYRAFIAQATEGIFRYEIEPGIDIEAPESEQIEPLLQHAYLVECNDTYARMYGFTMADELFGTKFGAHFPPSDPQNIAYLQTYIRSGYQFKDMASHKIDKEGKDRYFSNNLIGIVEAGKLVRVWGVQRDVTARRQAEQTLKAYSERLEELVAERTAELEAEITERKKTEETLRRRVVELEVVAQVSTAASTILDSALLMQTVVELTRDHFNLSHVHIGLLDESGGFLHMAASADEIGRQVMADSPVLYLNQDRSLATLAATTRQCVVVNDVSLEPNYLAHPLLEAVQSEMVVPMIVGERLIGVMAVQSNQLNRFSEEDVVIHKILAAQVAVAIENARRFEALQQTILQLQETQEKLMRQETLAVLGQLAGGVGHELRNPLGVVSNAVYFLRAILTGADETVDEYLNLIDSRVQEAEKIVTDLLNLSGNRIADRARVSALQLVEETLARQPPPKSVETTIYIPSELPLLFIDPQQIRQVLINLVANAYQAMPEGGTLTIAARVVSKETKVSERGIEVEDSPPLPRSPAPLLPCIQLTIADTGIGMAADTMAKIFEPLYTTKSKGIGLGLAVSRHLVEVNGGHLEAQSAEGQGSTFILTLPTKK